MEVLQHNSWSWTAYRRRASARHEQMVRLLRLRTERHTIGWRSTTPQLLKDIEDLEATISKRYGCPLLRRSAEQQIVDTRGISSIGVLASPKCGLHALLHQICFRFGPCLFLDLAHVIIDLIALLPFFPLRNHSSVSFTTRSQQACFHESSASISSGKHARAFNRLLSSICASSTISSPYPSDHKRAFIHYFTGDP